LSQSFPYKGNKIKNKKSVQGGEIARRTKKKSLRPRSATAF